MVSPVTPAQPTKVSKKLTKRAQKNLNDASEILESFCQSYPASRVEPTESELKDLWERCAYFRPQCLAGAVAEQLSLRDGEMEWQPRLRVLCALEFCFQEMGTAPRSVAKMVCDENHSLMQYLASDVPQCRTRAARVMELAAAKHPKCIAPHAVAPPMPQSVAEPPEDVQGPLAEQPQESQEKPEQADSQEPQATPELQPPVEVAEVDPDVMEFTKLEMDKDDSETTASSCGEKMTRPSSEDDISAETPAEDDAIPKERAKASSAAMPKAPGPSSGGNMMTLLEGLSFDNPSAHQRSKPSALAEVFEVPLAEDKARPFLWLADVQTATLHRETWQDPLADVNPKQLQPQDAAAPL